MKYAVLVEESVYIEGDERSRTNPGHGYPAHTQNYSTFREFKDQKELLDWVRISGKHTKYKAIQYTELEIITEVKIKVEPVKREISQLELLGH